MRSFLAASVALVFGAGAAVANPVAPGISDAVAVFNGVYSSAAPVTGVGNVIDLSGLTAIGGAAASFEFLGFTGSDPVTGLTLDIEANVPGVNVGKQFAIAYDRALVPAGDRAVNVAPNNQVGTMIAEITATSGLNQSVFMGTPSGLSIGGTLMFQDLAGFYTDVEGAWLLNITFASVGVSTGGAATLVLSTDPNIIPTAASEPAMIGAVGASLVVMGLIGRRRR